MEVLEILRSIIKFNTIKDLQNEEMIDWIENFLRRYNFKCIRGMDENSNKINLVAEIGEEPILAFSGHIDTVDISDGWVTDPFELTISQNRAYGLRCM